MNKIVHLGLFLAIVSAIAGGALAFANQMTAPVIAANNEKQEKESLLAMYPDANANDFKLVDAKLDSKTVQKVYEYKNVYVWKYKVVNGNLYKRKYNIVTGKWVGKWMPV